jgi:hypothetical protein
VATSGAAAVAALGLLVGIVFTLLSSPVFTSTTVLLGPSAARYVETQVAIAGSDPVLQGALPNVRPVMSLSALRRDIQVKSLTNRVLSISAQGATTAQAARTANAVADSYIAFVDANITPGQPGAQVVDRAVGATGTPLPARLLVPGGLGCPAWRASRCHHGTGVPPQQSALTDLVRLPRSLSSFRPSWPRRGGSAAR